MRLSLLYGCLLLLVATPTLHWSLTLSSGLAWKIYLHDLGRLLALNGFVLILFQFVLSSKIKWIEKGIGLDGLYRVHRKLGQLGIVLVTLHPAFLIGSLVSQGYGLSGALQALGLVDLPLGGPEGLVSLFWAYRSALNAYLALFGFILVVLAAVLYGRLRLLSYEAWRKVHYASYALLPIAFVHSMVLGSDLQSTPLSALWIALIAIHVTVLVHRVWKHLYLRKHDYRVAAVTKVTHDTWNLEFEGRSVEHDPGQFMILQLNRQGKTSEPHPFTISSSPRQPLSVTIKSVGDFTSTMGDTRVGDLAYIDAPYGKFSFVNHDTRDLVFVAGGIGITPFLSMLRHIRDAGLERNVTLIWGNKTRGDVVFGEEFEAMSASITSLRIVDVMSQEEDWGGETGFVNEELLRRHIPDFASPQFFVCGPPPMMESVISILMRLGVPRDKIHSERFSLR